MKFEGSIFDVYANEVKMNVDMFGSSVKFVVQG